MGKEKYNKEYKKKHKEKNKKKKIKEVCCEKHIKKGKHCKGCPERDQCSVEGWLDDD